jgi:WD40-like Beta Propeller Repeat
MLQEVQLDRPGWTTCETFDDGPALFEAVCKLDLESVVAKMRPALTGRASGWIKTKNLSGSDSRRAVAAATRSAYRETVPEGRSVKPVVTCGLIGIVAVAALAAGMGFATTPGVNGLIAYSGQHQLFTIRADGTRKQQLTQNAVQAQAVHADWSPNGTRIVFGLERKDGARIVVMSADGSGVRVLPPRGFQGQPSFSPDGKWIVYERNIADGNNGVWLMRANGTDLREVTRSPFGCCDTDPNFSPDGKTVSFVRIKARRKLQAIFSVRRDGSGLRLLTPYGGRSEASTTGRRTGS